MSHRQGQETENQGEVGGTGTTRTQPNPQERDGRSLLTKLVYAPSADQRFKLTVEGNEDEYRHRRAHFARLAVADRRHQHVRVLRPTITRPARACRSRTKWMRSSAGFADSLDWQVYRQDSETTQYTREERTLPPPAPASDRREREFNFDQRLYGLQANFRKGFATGAVQHDLAYGLDVSRTRDAGRSAMACAPSSTPASSRPSMLARRLPGARFPDQRDHARPRCTCRTRCSFADGDFRLIPAVRVDHYKLKPEVDNIFAEDNPGVAVSELSETNVSPKLGAVWHFADDWSLFGGYARGFRSPPYNDVNIGFTNLQFGYTAIANPDLKPETSDGVEAGLRFAGDAVYASVSGYYNRYDDFIESLRFIGFNARRR